VVKKRRVGCAHLHGATATPPAPQKSNKGEINLKTNTNTSSL